MCQILETIPISDEVSDLVQKLGNFYTETDIDDEEAEENDVDRRPFTRPFAQHAGNARHYRCQNNCTLESTLKVKRIQTREGPAAQFGCSTAANSLLVTQMTFFWILSPSDMCFLSPDELVKPFQKPTMEGKSLAFAVAELIDWVHRV